MMMNIILQFLLLLVQVSPGGNDAQNILLKSDGFRNSENSSAEVNLTLKYFQKDRKNSEIKYDVWYKGHDNSIVKQITPEAGKGTIILMSGPNMWHYKPGDSNPLRITPQQKLLGGASNADIAKMGFSFDYNASLIGIDTCSGKKCYKLNLTAKDEKLAYQKIIYYIDEENYLPVKAEFLTVSGRLMKTAFYSDYKTFVDNFKTPSKIKIVENLFNRQNYTEIEYNSIKKKNFPNKYFNYNYLENLK